MRAKLLLVGIAMAALAGCQHHDESAPSAADNEAAAAVHTAVADNSLAARADGLPVPQPSASATPGTLTQPFFGKWGMNKADCDPNRPDTKGLIDVKPDMLVFYESRGKVMAIDHAGPNDVTVRLAMTGEGQSWSLTDELRLDPSGTGLDRTEDGRTYHYDRC